MTQRAEITGADEFLTSAEVGLMLRVDPKTVTRWAKAGRLSSVKTPGGRRRYLRSEVEKFLQPIREPYGPITPQPAAGQEPQKSRYPGEYNPLALPQDRPS